MKTQRKTPVRVALGAALALSTATAMAGEITLFEHQDFGGRGVTVYGQAPDLQATAFNDTATSMVVRDGVWQACTDPNFQGRCVQLYPGTYRNLNGSLDRSVASVREITSVAISPPSTVAVSPPTVTVAPPTVSVAPSPPVIVATGSPRLVLFENRNFGGSSVEINSTTPNLEGAPAYDNAAAAIVYAGTWRLCSEQFSRGDCSDFAPGRYQNLSALNGRVRSAELLMPGSPVAVGPQQAEIGRVVIDENTNQPVVPDQSLPRAYMFAR